MTVTWSLSELFARAAPREKAEPGLERWRALLYWSAQTPHYWAQSGLLADVSVLTSASAIRSQLRQVAPVPLRYLLTNPKEFRSGYSKALPSQPAWSFWDTPAHIGVIHPWFRSKEPVQAFPTRESLEWTARGIERAELDVMVASPAVLLRLARCRITGPRRAIISIQRPGMRALTEAERDLLWRRFHVPLYQQLRGFQGELLAAECDAQVGFHTNPAAAHWEVRQQELVYTSLVNLRHPVLRLASGWHGDIETSRCGCGCLSVRLFPYEQRALLRPGSEFQRTAQLKPPASDRRMAEVSGTLIAS